MKTKKKEPDLGVQRAFWRKAPLRAGTSLFALSR